MYSVYDFIINNNSTKR